MQVVVAPFASVSLQNTTFDRQAFVEQGTKAEGIGDDRSEPRSDSKSTNRESLFPQ